MLTIGQKGAERSANRKIFETDRVTEQLKGAAAFNDSKVYSPMEQEHTMILPLTRNHTITDDTDLCFS